jgi:hypothetical protein
VAILSEDFLKSLRNRPGAVAIVGSIIILVGQLGATMFPIMLGPDLSDYNLLCDPVYHEIKPPSGELAGWTRNQIVESNISLISMHPIHSYKRQVSLIVNCPTELSATVYPPIVTIDKPSVLHIEFNYTKFTNTSKYYPWVINQIFPITIKGLGADGKERSCTVLVELKEQPQLFPIFLS